MEVSVIIPAYNVAKYLRESVLSALDQPETKEVVIVDDGSKDDTLQVAQGLEAEFPGRVKAFTQQNAGSAVARNVAIENSTAPFIAFIDADDYFLPNRFVRTKEIFEQNPDIDGVYEAIENVHEDETKGYSTRHKIEEVRRLHMVRQVVPPEDLLELLLTDELGVILLQGLCVKREVFNKAGKFTPEFREGQDMLMIKQIAAACRLLPGDLEQPVSHRRIHTTNITFSEFKDRSPTMFKEGEALFNWAKCRNLSSRKMNVLLKHYYKQYLYRNNAAFGDKKALRQFLAKVLKAYPKVIFLKGFWQMAPITGRFVK